MNNTKNRIRMNNTRNRIRMTESQLHNVIKESVKQVLSELDWKTYQNAAIKAKGGHVVDTLPNDKALYVRTGEKGGLDSVKAKKHYEGPNDINHRSRAFTNAAVRSFNKQYPSVPWNSHDTIAHGGEEAYSEPIVKLYPKYDYSRRRCDDETYDNATKDMRDYWDGNYEYEPNGRGWHLKDNMDESIRRAIRKVLH